MNKYCVEVVYEKTKSLIITASSKEEAKRLALEENQSRISAGDVVYVTDVTLDGGEEDEDYDLWKEGPNGEISEGDKLMMDGWED